MGQRLFVCPTPDYPPPNCTAVVVKQFDTCLAVAARFNVTVACVTEGGAACPGDLAFGDKLLVCPGADVPTPAPAPPAPTPPAPAPPKTVCSSSEYCCPDAKACLTPTKTSCAANATACAAGDVCCPLTKICVTPGAACVSPCAGTGDYCCPLAKHCVTPTAPGKFCKAGGCAKGEVCCPLTFLCVTVGAACTAPAFMAAL